MNLFHKMPKERIYEEDGHERKEMKERIAKTTQSERAFEAAKVRRKAYLGFFRGTSPLMASAKKSKSKKRKTGEFPF